MGPPLGGWLYSSGGYPLPFIALSTALIGATALLQVAFAPQVGGGKGGKGGGMAASAVDGDDDDDEEEEVSVLRVISIRQVRYTSPPLPSPISRPPSTAFHDLDHASQSARSVTPRRHCHLPYPPTLPTLFLTEAPPCRPSPMCSPSARYRPLGPPRRHLPLTYVLTFYDLLWPSTHLCALHPPARSSSPSSRVSFPSPLSHSSCPPSPTTPPPPASPPHRALTDHTQTILQLKPLALTDHTQTSNSSLLLLRL